MWHDPRNDDIFIYSANKLAFLDSKALVVSGLGDGRLRHVEVKYRGSRGNKMARLRHRVQIFMSCYLFSSLPLGDGFCGAGEDGVILIHPVEC